MDTIQFNTSFNDGRQSSIERVHVRVPEEVGRRNGATVECLMQSLAAVTDISDIPGDIAALCSHKLVTRLPHSLGSLLQLDESLITASYQATPEEFRPSLYVSYLDKNPG